MTDKEEVRAKIIDIIQQELNWQGDIPEDDLANHLDSMNLMSLVIAVEDQWEICLEPEDEAVINNLQDLVDVVVRKTSSEVA